MMVSVVMINLNNANGVKKTLASLEKMIEHKVQFVVVDGQSIDDSLELIKGHLNKIDVVISEADSGIYDAMNKGVRQSKGDYVLMLNSGDSLWNQNVIELFINLQPPPTEDIIYGNVMWEENRQQFVGKFPSQLTFNFFLTQSLGHQAMFVKKSLLEKMGFYREDYTIISDWAFELDAIVKYNASYRYWDEIISLCPRDGISCRPESQSIIREEKNRHLKENYAALMPDYAKHKNVENELNGIKNRKIFRFLKRLRLS